MRFTDEELLTLAEMLTLACWATFWNHKPGADEGVARYDDMLEKILTRLQHNGQGKEVEHDPERQRLRLSKQKEEGSFYAQCYDEMRNETFWEELVARMAERELLAKYGDKHLNALSDEERKKITEPVSKKYWEEFSRNGIGNLHVIARREMG
ncbi:hypothetical protein JIN77_07255 [Verrucomicrobiaceae bacterium R5-34]|uniref:Uncharacterized protein n=1 Tax=Oceaniferula flava TaxID=2800421 RepID=A0AAE2SBZ1_9BACT|nr:hypothetical protein [Oceaniferula flavus]MBK1830517.1 hypothetical protein [Verrucomicrobiaceae bacterium R5-34]MBK1854617.1 hypothetical protein [Oceaniferula flavus]MBM1135923.1 hypothetical protein [Oceaniferula flavus]